MFPITLNLLAAEKVDPDGDATFRQDFLNVVSHIGLSRDQVVALVDASSGRPFAACGATDLLPVLGKLLALVQSVSTAGTARPACDV
jgi:hypothetical protein